LKKQPAYLLKMIFQKPQPPKSLNEKDVGIFGEKIAADYLKKNGYKILEKNFRNRWGEIDIAAKKKRAFVFVEVKASNRSSSAGDNNSFHPEDRIDWKKKKQLLKMSEIYLAENRIPFDSPYRIDIIAIEFDNSGYKTKIRHYKNALEDSY